jgi:hypothetical protein
MIIGVGWIGFAEHLISSGLRSLHLGWLSQTHFFIEEAGCVGWPSLEYCCIAKHCMAYERLGFYGV